MSVCCQKGYDNVKDEILKLLLKVSATCCFLVVVSDLSSLSNLKKKSCFCIIVVITFGSLPCSNCPEVVASYIILE